MPEKNDLDLDWLTPVLGFVGLLAGTLFFTSPPPTSSNQNNNPSSNNNSLPPPPVGQKPKPSGCGCQHQN